MGTTEWDQRDLLFWFFCTHRTGRNGSRIPPIRFPFFDFSGFYFQYNRGMVFLERDSPHHLFQYFDFSLFRKSVVPWCVRCHLIVCDSSTFPESFPIFLHIQGKDKRPSLDSNAVSIPGRPSDLSLPSYCHHIPVWNCLSRI